MEKKTKPYYNKSNGEKVFKALRQEAQEITALLEPKKRFEIRFKAILFPLLYLTAWLSCYSLGKYSMGILQLLPGYWVTAGFYLPQCYP